MAANDFFGNANRQGRPDTYSNRPGFTIGGPVTIPKVYNGKNKTFFFFSYESINDSRPRFDANNIWAPTDALKNGDFSAFASSVKIYDPLTGTFNAGTGVTTNRTQFANNIIPASRINPVAKAVLGFMGSPKQGPQGNFLINNNLRDSTLPTGTTRLGLTRTLATTIDFSVAIARTTGTVVTITTPEPFMWATDFASSPNRLSWTRFTPSVAKRF